MKTKLPALLLVLLTGLELWAQVPAPNVPAVTPPARRTLPRFGGTNAAVTQPRFATPPAASATDPTATAAPPEEMIPAGTINFQGVDASQVLEIYSQFVGRTLLQGNVPASKITLKTQTPLTKTETIQALQAVLALNGIAVVNIGDKFVKVGPTAEANTFGAELNDSPVDKIPNLGSYITHITQLKYVKPSLMIPLIQPFAKLQGGLFAIDDNGILVMRDYAENIKRMLEMIARIDISVPAEFISEVIPIRYADAADIASALNSLGGGGGGSTVSFGSTGSTRSISGLRGGTTGSSAMGSGGLGSGLGGGYSSGGSGGLGGASRSLGTTSAGATSSGTPSSGSSFQQRLQSIIGRSGGGTGGGSGQDQIQLFGQTKIIADQRSNSLLVFATRADMENIKEVISKLDVLLAQVLIESIIMDVGLGNTLSAGVSAVQKPDQFNNSDVVGGGIMNNGNNSFLSRIRNLATNGSGSVVSRLSGILPTNSTGGLSYFTSIGDTWDIAVRAAESDSTASIIQRPRIQTSQAKPAQFFIGETVPYVTSTYNNSYSGGYGGSSYSQLSVGVELIVTPFINPDGLVVMEIQQEIDEISGYTSIDGNKVPNTIKRSFQTEIAVRNRDTVILGGFVRSDKSDSNSGVPFLKDIPLLGWLFRSTDKSKNRTELMVMMRPTVLKTPEIAAAQTIKEAQRLPGVSAAAADNAREERALIEAERKKELKRAKKGGPADGFFNMKTILDDTNTAPDVDFGSSPAAAAAPKKTTPEVPPPAEPAVEPEPAQ
jgi:general secretion pathway protein D